MEDMEAKGGSEIKVVEAQEEMKKWEVRERLKKHPENRKTLPFEILFSCHYVKVFHSKNFTRKISLEKFH